MRFIDRTDAGRRLAMRLKAIRDEDDVVVLGLARGGVPVAFEVAAALGLPLDVIMVRKLGVPWSPEVAMGAIGENGARVLNDDVLRAAGVSTDELADVENAEREELSRQVRQLRGTRPPIPLTGRIAIIVDDGIATGATARAACEIARAHGARRVVVATPVAAPGAASALRAVADEVICLDIPAYLHAIGSWYDDFAQVSDQRVQQILGVATVIAATGNGVANAGSQGDVPNVGHPDQPIDRDVRVPAGEVELPGRLRVPASAPGVVVFAHGSGSSRLSPRNRYVANVLAEARLGTLLFDLLTPGEEADRGNVFDIELLSERLTHAVAWLQNQTSLEGGGVGLFGASTGAAAALLTASQPGADIAAVVSRGGRPDLAGDRLASVTTPTLLIVGSLDVQVLRLNQRALERLKGPKRMEIVPGATHLFSEPGTLELAAGAAKDWFLEHMTSTAKLR